MKVLLFPFDMAGKPYFRPFENIVLKLQKFRRNKHTTNQQETFLVQNKKKNLKKA